MKNYKVEYKETNIHHFIVPAKSKKQAIQHVKDRIYWDLDPIDETSDSWSVKDYIAEEISEALVKNGHDNSIVLWDISCELPDEV